LNERLSRLPQKETFFPVHSMRMGPNLYHFPDDAFQISRFLGLDIGVTKLEVATQVYAVLGNRLFLWTIKPDVLMVLFDPVCPM
jgi:hypothetical protein